MSKKCFIQQGVETPSTFPAVGLRRCATWILDNAAASKLSPVYLQDHPVYIQDQ
ncbi:hypothetical protein T492DRAFT_897574 [Pavlovales sp. CCMP2436]|nr:hypothetical protein T492DRAFT_897574 [Pavlovales sp. CCMP2436]